jgi:hypothetical protein
MFGAGGETRTHVGFPTAYKTVAIAAMRLQRLFVKTPLPGCIFVTDVRILWTNYALSTITDRISKHWN